MKIQSPFKDYYDFVEHLYGSDPKVTYVRDKLVKDKLPVKQQKLRFVGWGANYNPDHLTVTAPLRISDLPNNISMRDSGTEYSFKWLVITGRYYLLVTVRQQVGNTYPYQYHYETSVFDESRHAEIVDSIYGRFFYERHTGSYYLNRADKALDELSRKVGQPVYVINGVHRWKSEDNISIDIKIPILKDLGIASLIDSQTLFQEIYTYMMNVIRESPDLAPPVKISDKDRLVQHGFDLKQSFRHRK